MNRFLSTLLIAVFAYKLGEQYSQINANDYYLTRAIDTPTGVNIEYLVINQDGLMDYETDKRQATPLNFWTAKRLRNLIKVHAPMMPIELEIVNPLLN